MYEIQRNERTPLSVFISYAHEDEPLRQQLEAHLSLLRRQGWIADWHDRQILAGNEWARDIDEHLEMASIILLLISPDFLASDYCYDIEMQRALERHKRSEARVIPIILRPCDWRTSPFSHLQGLPTDGKAVTTWQNQDEAFLSIVQGLRQTIKSLNLPAPSLPKVERQNRTRLLKRVRAIWIEGLLEDSLHHAVRIELHLQERPDVLENPWRVQVQELGQVPRPLPAGTSIVQVYDEADGELFILGEPGSGKTTLLLQLARTLLSQAEHDERQRMPIVFNLSSWAEKRQPLRKWLVEELWTKYQVPRHIGHGWIMADQVLPLLDGLDEVAEDARAGCVLEINAYYQSRLEHGSSPLVVCYRSNEYAMMSTRILIPRAVSILPLSKEQIDRYLEQFGGHMSALRRALDEDIELYTLAQYPLMLNIFSLIYQEDKPAEIPSGKTPKDMLHAVFATYVRHMFNRRMPLVRWEVQKVIHWLAFLAEQMQQHHQTTFALEELQSDWLSPTRRRLYQWSIRLFFWLFFGLTSELSFGLLFTGFAVGIRGREPEFLGLIFGLVCGLVFTLAIGRRYWNTKIHPAEVVKWTREKPPSQPYFEPLAQRLGWQQFERIGRQLDELRNYHGGRYLLREQLIERFQLSPNKGICQGRCNHEPIWNWPPW